MSNETGARQTEAECRYCGRGIYQLGDGSWTLTYIEYARPWLCDARDMESSEVHEPAEEDTVAAHEAAAQAAYAEYVRHTNRAVELMARQAEARN